MEFTSNYPKLVDAVNEVNLQMALDRRNADKALTLLTTLKILTQTVNKTEREAGNTEDWVSTFYSPESIKKK